MGVQVPPRPPSIIVRATPLRMTNLDKDNTRFVLDTGEQTRRPSRRLPKPMIRLLLFVAALIVLIVIIVVATRGCSSGGDASDYNRYMLAVADILEQSDAVGADLSQLLTDPGDTNRAQVQTKLDSFVASCEQLEVEAEKLETPKYLLDVHQMFLVVMNFRQQGVTELKPAIMGALEVQDTEVPAQQIQHALYYFTSSDFLYAEVFVRKTSTILGEQKISGVLVPTSQFFTDPNLASKNEVLAILGRLKSTGVLQAVHGVALKKVVARPDNTEITAGDTFNLTMSDELAFVVTVENQGNMDETDVPVVISLRSSESAEPVVVSKKIPSIKAKTEIEVTIEGLTPAEYGEVALLRVEVGPVPQEKNSNNNSLEADVIFKL
jgi:hypothetical protein